MKINKASKITILFLGKLKNGGRKLYKHQKLYK